ncbi:ATP-binding cassette domain-containing protein [Mycetocola zhadangensis]|uniref:ABC transporter ATP-binding protein n=1 Tax=Mycetocola zhadangensis TaxID=1164595 RepID=UPI003A4E014D
MAEPQDTATAIEASGTDASPSTAQRPTATTSGTPAKKKSPPRKPAAGKAGGQRARVAASVAKSPTEVAEHVAPKVTLDTSEIPPVPPLPVVPPVPPLPADVSPRPEADVPQPVVDNESSFNVVDSADDLLLTEPADAAGEDMASPVVSSETEHDERPPLPKMSAEEAALQFESRPDAAEQATGLDSHEPMKFVWSKRWPFLSFVPAASTTTAPSTAVAPAEHDSAGVDEDSFVDTSDIDLDARPSADSDSVGSSESERDTFQDFFPDNDSTEVIPEQTAEVDGASQEDASVAPLFVEPRTVPDDEISVTEPVPETQATAATVEPETELLSTEPATEILPDYAAMGIVPEDVITESIVDDSTSESTVAPTETTVLPVRDVDARLDASAGSPIVLSIRNLSRSFGDTIAVDGIDLDVREGSFYGIVGPNGAGKTTTLSMITGLLRPDSGNITVHGVDVWENPDKAKRSIGVLPDRLRLFDRLTGAQLLYYSGVLRGFDGATVRSRVKDLAAAFGLEDALNRLVTDYSAGMTKKVALASAMIHSPRLLVLDEPFESVDPVSAANVIEILQKYVAHGGTVVLSSHGMDLIQRVCDHVAIVVNGQVLAAGAVDDVRGSGTLEDRFVELAGGRKAAEGMEWLHSFSD